MKKILEMLFLVLFLSGCIDLDIIPAPDPSVYLRDKNGDLVEDCQGNNLTKNSINTEYFWKNNNLPKGTTDFVCINGKAYLNGKELN